jgi:transposase
MKAQESRYKHKTKLRELVFAAYLVGDIDKDTAVARIGVSSRQFYRLQNQYITHKNLEHGLCNKSSNRQIHISIKDQVLQLYKTIYRGCNYEHFSELLVSQHNLNIHSATLRTWLLDAKLSLPKKRKPKKYNYREPKPRFNQMLQLDGTFGDFLGNGTQLCLMHLVDDATKTSLAMLFAAECTQSALELLYQWCIKHGIPESIYSDRHSTYKVNERQRLTIEEELEDLHYRRSEFGKICDRLGIKQIFAHSPQAKGRVEKKHQMYKDRYIKELRIFGITTIADANAYLTSKSGFIERLNNKFTISPKEIRSTSVIPNPVDLVAQFALHSTRIVRNDYTIQFNSIVYQITTKSVIKPKTTVLIKKYLDGHMAFFFGKQQLQVKCIDNYVKPVKEVIRKTQISAVNSKKPYQHVQKIHPFKMQYKAEKTQRYPSSSKQLDSLGQIYG